MPLHSSRKPIQRTRVPLNEKVARAPNSSDRTALPPLKTGPVCVYQVPVKVVDGAFCSYRTAVAHGLPGGGPDVPLTMSKASTQIQDWAEDASCTPSAMMVSVCWPSGRPSIE